MQSISFMLAVDNFGVKYINIKDVEHLIASFKKTCKLTKVWSGNLYCNITLEWYYDNHMGNISMPVYIQKKNCRSTTTLYPAQGKHAYIT
jgi:hypothetical protein